MPPSAVWSSCLQAGLLQLITAICDSHLYDWAFDIPEAGTRSRMESIYFYKLSQTVFFALILTPLRFWWQIFLERLLPTRSTLSRNGKNVSNTRSTENDVAEEKIIDEWIAQGKVQRSTISWSSIFAKWMLNLIIGNIWLSFVEAVAWRLWDLTPLGKQTAGTLWESVLIQFLTFFLSPAPLISFLAFIIIPAHKRIVFEDGMDLVYTVFFLTLGSVLYPWMMSFPFIQEIVRNGTLAMNATDESMEKLEL